MASGGTVWGIDIGQCALKAIKVRQADDGKVEAIAFDLIEHPKILSQPDADPDELIRAAIEKFASRNDWQRDTIVLGVPGQQTFARFCKLPPVDPKKIPDIVRFEASQQIPFDIEDVVWDYEVFSSADSPETEVGIFAMRKDLVRKQIEYLTSAGLSPTAIQTLPSALYNFAHFDEKPADDGAAIVLIDVGAQNTDLIVIEPQGAWTRNIPLGGNNFTEALIKSFKLSFAKAESLKRSAATSKYARQIFQAMRPVFAELVAEIQRSLGFYASTHRDMEIKSVLAMGNAFRLPGLQKYLENNLTVGNGVTKLEKFKTLMPSATINAPQFTENILSFGAAYGLALQGLGMSKISANLLPTELARVVVWKRKLPYWIASAACLGLAAVSPWSRNMVDKGALAGDTDPVRTQVSSIINEAEKMNREFAEVSKDTTGPKEKIQRLMDLQKEKHIIPRIIALVHEAMPEVDPQLASVSSPEQLKQLIARNPNEFARTKRRQIIIESLDITFSKEIEKYTGSGGSSSTPSPTRGAGGPPTGIYGPGGFGPGMGGGGRGLPDLDAYDTDDGGGLEGAGFYVHITGRLLYGTRKEEASQVIAGEFYKRLQEFGQAEGLGFYVLVDEPGKERRYFRKPTLRTYGQDAKPRGTAIGPMGPGQPEDIDPAYIDPVTGESMMDDWVFDFGFKIMLGEKPATEEKADE